MNVTATDATAAGFVTVFPCGEAMPTASNLNYVPGGAVPNAVVAKVGTDGNVCLYTSAPTHLVVDVNGFFPSTTSLHSTNPGRLLDTRPGHATVDGVQQGEGLRAPGSITQVQITGRAGVPSDAIPVVLNVTVTETTSPGFLTVFPCGTSVPTASNLNYVTNSTVANMVVSKIGTGGAVCIFNQSGLQLIADSNGYFPATTTYHPLDPARLMDTRPGTSTIDGNFLGAGLRPAGTVTELTVTNRGGVPAPAGVAAVVLNVTVTEPTAAVMSPSIRAVSIRRRRRTSTTTSTRPLPTPSSSNSEATVPCASSTTARPRSSSTSTATSDRGPVQPPATAGMMLTVSPSGTFVSTPSR